MKEKLKYFFSSFLLLFFSILIVGNSLAIILLIDDIHRIDSQIKSIKENISTIEVNYTREQTLSETKLLDFYHEIDQESNEAINRVLTIVGVITGIFTLFSLLLAYKAPHDIDKRIQELDNHIIGVKKSADEAKYQALISSAMARTSGYNKIKELNSIIRKYPDKPDGYIQRGIILNDQKKFDLAIVEFELAKKFGIDMNIYYNGMGVAYSNKDENKTAIGFYTKAIELDKNDASYYCNRACALDDIGNISEALLDYEKAIELDSYHFEVYYNRSFIYNKLWQKETDELKKEEYKQLRKKDLEKAIELNPDDTNAQKILRELINQSNEPESFIAKLDEKIADISVEEGETNDSVKSYLDAYQYYMSSKLNNDCERIENKITKLVISISDVDKQQNIKNDVKINKSLLYFIIYKKAMQMYLGNDKTNSEICFNFLYPDTALNLAYMKRRKETKIVERSTVELLDACEDKDSAVWCVNRALCYVDGDIAHNDWHQAVDEVKKSKKDIDSAIEWWMDISVVGEKENNVVILLMQLSYLYNDDVPINERIKSVEKFGYIIPADYKTE